MPQANPFTALIFGGSGVIGGAIARKFGHHQWTVGIQYFHNQQHAQHIATHISQAGSLAHVYQANVQNPADIKDTIRSFTNECGRLEVVIWSVGMGTTELVAKTSPEQWIQTIQTNLTGAFSVLKEVFPYFERQNNGTMIVIGSYSGEHGSPGQTAYAASKAGLMGLIRSATKEWGKNNIRVNAVFPGWQKSPLSTSGYPERFQSEAHMLGRTPAVEEVANTVYHLALTKDISGQVWNLDSRIG